MAPGPAPDSRDAEILCVRLHPHRSLTRRGFWTLLAVFALMNLAATAPFILAGAWPVAGFAGLDIVALAVALLVNFRAARAYEFVRVTPLELRLDKVSPSGRRAEWRFNPSWVRIERRDHPDDGIESLAIAWRDRRVEVAAFLGREARAAFAGQLQGALAQARRGPRFS